VVVVTLYDCAGTIATYGLMDDGMTAYVPGINCILCGRFVGRDGSIEIDYREMSSEVSSIEGECGACLRRSSFSVLTEGEIREVERAWGVTR
jgi:hypothetical protein